ncbi:hypothetical protein [Herbaspirillum robiniae]|uniref:hypothetical protein n=1 Tax=Herbaspirillum robiniae TaxID=2014887 RepID=UPI003D77171F
MTNHDSISLDLTELAHLKKEAARHASWADRISLPLAFRLLGIVDSGAYFDAYDVIREIDHLEGHRTASSTKAETQFKKPPLHPFWHKHFFQSNLVLRNIAIRWNLDDGGNKDLDRMINEVAESHGDDPSAWPSLLAHRMTIEAFEDRAERGLTGHWIIFAKQPDGNIYLDLAAHEEGISTNAINLYQKLLQGCAWEFPHLFAPNLAPNPTSEEE